MEGGPWAGFWGLGLLWLLYCCYTVYSRFSITCFYFHSEDGEEEAMYQDTDSDVAEARDCGKVLKVKWTQEEVSLSASQSLCLLICHRNVC